MLRGRGRRFSSSSSGLTNVLSFLLNKALSPKAFLAGDRGLREGSMPDDAEPYPESFEERDVWLMPLSLEVAGGVRCVVSRAGVVGIYIMIRMIFF